MRLGGWMMVCLAGGCAATRDAAPEDLDGLVRYAFSEFEDPDAMVDAMEGFRPWFEGEGRTDAAHEGLRVTPLSEADTTDVLLPEDADLSLARGVAAGCPSPWPLDAHASLLLDADQTWLDPGNYPRYDRDLLEGGTDFLDGDGVLRTLNDIERRNVGVSIPFLQRKDYRWVHLEDRDVIAARSWIEQSSCSDSGDNCVVQGYAIDLFWEEDGETVRFTASWSEVKTLIDGVLSEDQLVAVAVNGILEIYENTDLELGRR